jgi:FixJ family two-component response regulator
MPDSYRTTFSVAPQRQPVTGNASIVHVVEDDAAMRDALAMLLKDAGIDMRGYRSAEDFLLDAAANGEPLCLLTDVRLPGMTGLALYEELVRRGAEATVVMITGNADVPMAVKALKSGVMDFIEKPFAPDMLITILRQALQRTAELKANRARLLDVEARHETLTGREREILELLVEGLSNKVVASRLGISVRTAEHHHASIMRKMNAQTTSQLVKMVLSLPRRPAADNGAGADRGTA